MSLAGLTSLSASPTSNPNNFLTERRQDATQLFSALENGDLSGAQTAYAKLAGLSSSGDPYTGPKLTSDFTAIGQALQGGDLTGAQQAALQFGQDLFAANQKIRDRGLHPEQPAAVINISAANSAAPSTGGATSGANPTPSPASSSGTSANSTSAAPEIVINLGQNGTPSIDLNVGGSEIEINLANASNGNNNATPIDLNFGNGSSASQIEISLGAANANSQNGAPAINITV